MGGGDGAGAVGIVVGSAVFNVLVVPAASALLSGGSGLQTDAELVYKEVGFYVLALAVLLLTFALAVIYEPTGPRTGRLTRPLAAAPLVLYGFYLFPQYADTAEHRASSGYSQPDRPAAQYWTGLVVVLVFVGSGSRDWSRRPSP